MIKEVAHTVNQSSSDCVVYKDPVEEFGKAETMSEEDLRASMSGSFYNKADRSCTLPPMESQAFVLYNISAEEATNSDAIDRLYTPIKEAQGWNFAIRDNALEAAVNFNNALTRRYMLITASDGVHYDTWTLYASKRSDKPVGHGACRRVVGSDL